MHRHLLKKISVIILVIVHFMPLISYANNFSGRWYQIELIIFSHINRTTLNTEQWPQITPIAFNQGSIVQLESPDAFKNYHLLTQKNFTLQKEQNELNQQSDYQLLLHQAWRQKVFEPNQAKPVHLVGGHQFNLNDNNKRWQVDGTVTVSVRRYFNVNFNFFFTEPVAQLTKISGSNYFSDIHHGFTYFHLMQSRRMRSGELNYIGHPLYGILIKITRIKNNS